jgi:hypothetical protein
MLFDLNDGLLQQFAPAGGAKGISWRQKTKKWRAAIRDPHGKTVLLGEFADIKNAVVAWNIAAIKYYGMEMVPKNTRRLYAKNNAMNEDRQTETQRKLG